MVDIIRIRNDRKHLGTVVLDKEQVIRATGYFRFMKGYTRSMFWHIIHRCNRREHPFCFNYRMNPK